LTDDGLRLEACWGTEQETLQKLAGLAGQAVRLEFEMTNAKLYAFDLAAR
jgi:hypothetical protein